MISRAALPATFADLHREFYDFWAVGKTVFVRLALRGTLTDPLEIPFGTILPTGKRMDAPCVDIWELEKGKIKKFDVLPRGLNKLDAAQRLRESHSGPPRLNERKFAPTAPSSNPLNQKNASECAASAVAELTENGHHNLAPNQDTTPQRNP
jgi:hypothetical protein